MLCRGSARREAAVGRVGLERFDGRRFTLVGDDARGRLITDPAVVNALSALSIRQRAVVILTYWGRISMLRPWPTGSRSPTARKAPPPPSSTTSVSSTRRTCRPHHPRPRRLSLVDSGIVCDRLTPSATLYRMRERRTGSKRWRLGTAGASMTSTVLDLVPATSMRRE